MKQSRTAQEKFAILNKAEETGNVAEVCRAAGISRTQFYEYKYRYQEHGLDGLNDLPPVRKARPKTSDPKIISRLTTLVLDSPYQGCVWYAEQLSRSGNAISPPTVQKILEEQELSSKVARGLALEQKFYHGERALTDRQKFFITKYNPCNREWERENTGNQPGEILAQGKFFVMGYDKNARRGRVYLDVVLDTHNYYCFGYLSHHRVFTGIDILVKQVFPFYKNREIKITRIITNYWVGYAYGEHGMKYHSLLKRSNIHHGMIRKVDYTNGYIDRFKQIVLAEFVAKLSPTPDQVDLKGLQTLFENWLYTYNHERPSLGYPNYGMIPADKW